ncbi:phospholipase C [Croceifilum oryzae]|uniref:Phospholipase C n=1 Tax=Croceifilum oryzae TaxID=1553429 RepID=A0AAJ1WRU4_9BACL|nr:phospholipase C [Croceifilum oryzae]
MKSKGRIMFASILLVASTIFPLQAAASVDPSHSINPNWTTGHPHEEGTNSHLWIVSRSIDIMTGSNEVQSQEVSLLKKWKDDLAQGLYDADHIVTYNNFGTFSSHFYDPDTGSSYLPGVKTAKETGVKYFHMAGEAYRSKDVKQAFYYLGLSLHFLTDLTQPMHSSNFTSATMPWGFHSKFEDFVDSFKENYKVTDHVGYWNFSNTAEGWLHKAAVQSKKDAPGILNSQVFDWYTRATFSDYYAAKWREEVIPTAGKRLIEAQRTTAGFLHFWFETYVN